jgi:hypothetical protein
VDGVYAQLRKSFGDPEWRMQWEDFKTELSKGFTRNKFNLKTQGKRMYRMRRSRDRTL